MKVEEYKPVELGVGTKHDYGKLRFDLLDPRSMEEFVKVLTFGAMKYSPDNWRLVEPERYTAALGRHINAWRRGEAKDNETGIHHLAHAMCNIMFLLAKELENE